MSEIEKSNAQKVEAFTIAFGGEQPKTPTVPALQILTLREKLLDEEYVESKKALTEMKRVAGQEAAADINETVAAFVHELTDLLYVTYGAILACGVDPDPIFAEIHRANMTKIGGPRRADGKQLKPKNWQPADVLSLVQQMSKRGEETCIER